MTYDEIIKRAEAVLKELEKGPPLEKAMALYAEGVTLLRDAQVQLAKAEASIVVLAQDGTETNLPNRGGP